MKSMEKVVVGLVLAAGALLVLAALLLFTREENPAGSAGLPGEGAALHPAKEAANGKAAPGVNDARLIPDRKGSAPVAGTKREGKEPVLPSAGGGPVITGRVLDAKKAPLADVEVSLFSSFVMTAEGLEPGLGKEGDPAKVPRCRTSADGRFRLKSEAPREGMILHVFHPRFVPENRKLGPIHGKAVDLGTLVLRPAGALSGRAFDPEGRPLAGVKVRAVPVERITKWSGSLLFFPQQGADNPEWRTRTGEDGTFRIQGLPPGKVKVLGTREGWLVTSLDGVEVRAGEERAGVELLMEPGLRLAGRVTDGRDRPVEGATVSVHRSGPLVKKGDKAPRRTDTYFPKETKSGPDGTFLLEGLKKGAYTLAVQAKGFVKWEREGIAAGREDVAVVLGRGGRLYGRVLDGKTGEGIDPFEMEVTPKNGSSRFLLVTKGKEAQARERALKDGRGAFLVEGLPKGPFDLVVSAEGYGDCRLEDLRVEPGGRAARTVKLLPEARISGTVFLPKGGPAAKARVTIKDVSTRPGFPDGISLQSPGDSEFVEQLLKNFFPGDKGGWSRSTRTGADGSFTVRGIPGGSGPFEILASLDGYLDTEPIRVTLAAGEAKDGLELTLREGGTIQGTVFDADGTRRAFAYMRADREDPPESAPCFTRADEQGRYVFEGMQPGTWRVRLQERAPDGFSQLGGISFFLDGETASNEGISVVVEAGKVTACDLHISPRAAIVGRVSAGGVPASGIQVELYEQQAGGLSALLHLPCATMHTDLEGTYRFDGLEPGAYRVSVSTPGVQAPVTRPLSLAPGEDRRLDFFLPLGTVSGRVVDARTGVGIRGARVLLEREGEKGDSSSFGMSIDVGGESMERSIGPREARADAAGHYAVQYVPGGTYRCKVSAEGYTGTTLGPFEVPEGGHVENPVARLERTFSVTGRVILSGTGKAPEKRVHLMCLRIENGKEDVRDYDATASDGTFSFDRLSPGKYRIRPTKGNRFQGSVEFEIQDRDLPDLVLYLEEG